MTPDWAVHTFWAPNVGKVYEYMRRADGTIIYTMKLVDFKVAKNLPPLQEASTSQPVFPIKENGFMTSFVPLKQHY